MPPKKKSKGQADAKKTATDDARSPTDGVFVAADPFQTMLGKDLTKKIFDFLLGATHTKEEIVKRRGHWYSELVLPLQQSVRTLPLVSKTWRGFFGEMVNKQVRGGELLSPSDLATLKTRVFQLDLTSVYDSFIKEVKKIWGNSEDGDVVDVVVDRFGSGRGGPGGTAELGFSKLVAVEYRRFLLVKSVETLVAKKVAAGEQSNNKAAAGAGAARSSSKITQKWLEKCVPSKLVDVFWHAHMLAPKKYMQDCNILIGEIIDHDAGYVSPGKFAGSDYYAKKKHLFQYELQFPTEDVFGGRLGNNGEGEVDTLLFGPGFYLPHLANMIWEDMYGANDCG